MALLLKNGRVVDPSVGLDSVCDIVIRDGVIVEVGTDLTIPKGIVKDCTGKVVVPGFVDMHVHLREPGREDEETVASGTRAAARGGFTAVCPMPNTDPCCDDAAAVRFILGRAEADGKVRVHPIGALTKNLEGSAIAEIGDMVAEGAVAFSDDGHGVQDSGTMRRVMDYAKQFGTTVIAHCEDEKLVGRGVVNEGVASSRLGLSGWPSAGEDIAVARDIALCELTGCKLHLAHCSTAGSMELVRAAKAKGLPVTCEVTPHHLFLDEDEIERTYDTSLKMNPPLRTIEDRRALYAAIADGTVDAIATDHAPHAAHEKALEFELAPFGTTGLETAVPLVLTNLVAKGYIGLDRMVDLMAHGPRRILGLDPVSIAPGHVADITVLDTEVPLTVQVDDFESKSVNSAFTGAKLVGMAVDVFIGGYAALENGKVVD